MASILQKEFRGVSELDLDTLVQEVVEDYAVEPGRFQTSFKSSASYTQCITRECINRMLGAKRLKKGHEVLFSQLESSRSRADRMKTTTLFIRGFAAPGPTPDKRAMERLLLRQVGEQVGALPCGMRDVIVLFREGFEYEEIAGRLGKSYNTVKDQFRKGVAALRVSIEKSGILGVPGHYPVFAVGQPKLDSLEKFVHGISFRAGLIGSGLAFERVHFDGMRVSEVCDALKEPRAAIEAMLLHVYWAIRATSRFAFPRDFLRELSPHRRYADHAVPFRCW